MTLAPASALVAAAPCPLHLADCAVVLLASGVLLLLVECLRPGLVIPGAFGLLLLLLGVHDLMQLPLHPLALVLLAGSILLFAVSAKRRLWYLGGLLGTVTLVASLLLLVKPRAGISRVAPALAVTSALALGPLSSTLLRVAVLARRSKRAGTVPTASARVD